MTDDRRHPFEGRLGRWPDQRLAEILDKRVARQLDYFAAQLEMDQAHTVMLVEQRIVTPHEAAAILGVLKKLEAGGADALQLGRGRSSLFWYVEAALIDQLGETVGGKMHTGRSHNDIMPTVSRMTARRRLLAVMRAVLELQEVLLRIGRDHVETVMPGYTALQHGQPWTLGHYLSAWIYVFARDLTRLKAAYENTNRSSLGASALAGTSWPLDRHRTAELLGFDGIIWNSHDAGFATRDYVLEALAALSITLSNLSNLCSDFYLWTSWEFGMIDAPDGFSGTSSFMPQKKNAWAFDWTRGAAGSAVGLFASALAALRGASSTDGAVQDYPERHLADAFELTTDYLRLTSGAVNGVEVRADVMLARAQANWTTASNLADVIALEAQLSFREAHGITGRVVRNATERGISPVSLTAEDVDRAAVEVVGRSIGLTDEQVREALDPVEFVRTRVTAGSVNPDEVRLMLDDGARLVEAERMWVDDRQQALDAARARLDRLVADRLAAT